MIVFDGFPEPVRVFGHLVKNEALAAHWGRLHLEQPPITLKRLNAVLRSSEAAWRGKHSLADLPFLEKGWAVDYKFVIYQLFYGAFNHQADTAVTRVFPLKWVK